MTPFFHLLVVVLLVTHTTLASRISPLHRCGLFTTMLPQSTIEITFIDDNTDETRYVLTRHETYSGESKILYVFEMPDSGGMVKLFDESIVSAGTYRYQVTAWRNEEVIDVVEAETFALDAKSESEYPRALDQHPAEVILDNELTLSISNDEELIRVFLQTAFPSSELTAYITDLNGTFVRILFAAATDKDGALTLSVPRIAGHSGIDLIHVEVGGERFTGAMSLR